MPLCGKRWCTIEMLAEPVLDRRRAESVFPGFGIVLRFCLPMGTFDGDALDRKWPNFRASAFGPFPIELSMAIDIPTPMWIHLHDRRTRHSQHLSAFALTRFFAITASVSPNHTRLPRLRREPQRNSLASVATSLTEWRVMLQLHHSGGRFAKPLAIASRSA